MEEVGGNENDEMVLFCYTCDKQIPSGLDFVTFDAYQPIGIYDRMFGEVLFCIRLDSVRPVVWHLDHIGQ